MDNLFEAPVGEETLHAACPGRTISLGRRRPGR